MKVIVTGSKGYLGSLLIPQLLNRGHEVTGIDVGYYESGYLYHSDVNTPRTIVKDIRLVSASDISGNDAIVHMAELSNDPAGDLSPCITHKINHEGSVRLAAIAKDVGIRRFIYMSSCSVYGVAVGNTPVTEETPVNPQTAYAICKTLCERDIVKLTDSDFSPVFLRNSTAYGASPRQRFDLVVNNLCALAWTTGEIKLVSDGSPWRPLVHALDIGKAICCALDAEDEAVRGQILNIGSNEQNYRVREIAEIIASIFSGCSTKYGEACTDNRSYQVNFNKLHEHIPEFSCDWDLSMGVRQLLRTFEAINLDRVLFEFPAYTRLKQLKHLMNSGQIDAEFHWKK